MLTIAKHILNFVMPPECHICGCRLATHEDFVCTACIGELPRSGYHRRKNNPMEEKFAGIFPFERASGHFFYSRDSALAQLVQDMKYRNFPDIGVRLGRLMGEELFGTGFFSDADMIVPVPMHFIKKARRGYNQADKIARGLSQASGIPVRNILRMTRRRGTQTALGREERLRNSQNLFKVAHPDAADGKRIILLDDVCTTGATLTGAAMALQAASKDIKLIILTLGVAF